MEARSVSLHFQPKSDKQSRQKWSKYRSRSTCHVCTLLSSEFFQEKASSINPACTNGFANPSISGKKTPGPSRSRQTLPSQIKVMSRSRLGGLFVLGVSHYLVLVPPSHPLPSVFFPIVTMLPIFLGRGRSGFANEEGSNRFIVNFKVRLRGMDLTF